MSLLNLFVYGTLLDELTLKSLLEGINWLYSERPASVEGILLFHPDSKKQFPFALFKGDELFDYVSGLLGSSSVQGKLITISSEASLEDILNRLDSYEGIKEGLFKRAYPGSKDDFSAYSAGRKLTHLIRTKLHRLIVIPDGNWKSYQAFQESKRAIEENTRCFGMESEFLPLASDGTCYESVRNLRARGKYRVLNWKGGIIHKDNFISILSMALHNCLEKRTLKPNKGMFGRYRKDNSRLPFPGGAFLYVDGEFYYVTDGRFVVVGSKSKSNMEWRGISGPYKRRRRINDNFFIEIAAMPTHLFQGFASLYAKQELKRRENLRNMLSSVKLVKRKRKGMYTEFKGIQLEDNCSHYNFILKPVLEEVGYDLSIAKEIAEMENEAPVKVSKFTKLCAKALTKTYLPLILYFLNKNYERVDIKTKDKGRIELRTGITNSLMDLSSGIALFCASMIYIEKKSKEFIIRKASEAAGKTAESLTKDDVRQFYKCVSIDDIIKEFETIILDPGIGPCKVLYGYSIQEGFGYNKRGLDKIGLLSCGKEKTVQLKEYLKSCFLNSEFNDILKGITTKSEFDYIKSKIAFSGNSNYLDIDNSHLPEDSALDVDSSFPENYPSLVHHMLFKDGIKIVDSMHQLAITNVVLRDGLKHEAVPVHVQLEQLNGKVILSRDFVVTPENFQWIYELFKADMPVISKYSMLF